MSINQTQLNGPEFGATADYVAPISVSPSIDYAETAVSRLANQFAGSTKLQAIVRAMCEPLNNVELFASELKNNRWIDTAIGKQLDGCGEIVGEKRQGRSDADYRNAIKFRVFVNTSQGTPSDLIKGLRLLTDPTDIQYIEQYPATAIMFTDGVSVPENIQSVIQSLAPAAVSDVPVLVSYGYKPFRFSRIETAAEMWANDDTEYLTIDGSDWTLSVSGAISGPSLGGLTATNIDIDNGYLLELDDGSELVFNDSNSSTVIESSYHLTGVY